MQNILKPISILFLIVVIIFSSTNANKIKKLNIGYFEAGKYDVHDLLRDEYFKQLEQILPDSIQLISIPDGYRSADWNRTNSKKMALQLTQNKNIDFILAFGPWVVQDLLDAGFDKPIIGMHQFNPKAEGLLGQNDRPIVDNLTVHFRPGKIYDDIQALTKLVPIRKLGLLYFPSDDTTYSLYKHVKSLGDQMGFDVITATEYDNKGDYAFFKSYNSIKSKRVDALYLAPLWGLESNDISKFFELLNRDKVPTFTDEGSVLLKQGATATNNYFGIVSEAYYNAYKTLEIINGATPADLPVIFRSEPHIAFNKQSAKLCSVDMRADIFNSYEIIGDDINTGISPSTLSELVNRGVTQNPQILLQLDKLIAADAEINIAKSAYKPQVYGESELYYTDNNFQYNLHNSVEKQIFRSSLNITQTLFSKEKLKEIKLTKELKEITKISEISEQLDLELAISLAYLDCLKLQEQSSVIYNFRSMLSYNLEILHAKQSMQNLDSLNYYRLDNYRYKMTLAYIENHQMFKTAQIILKSLLNLPPDEKIVLEKEYFSENQFIDYESSIISKLQTHKIQDEIGNQLLEKMLSQSPNQSKSNAIIAYNKTALEKHKASFYPEFQLQGSLRFDDFYKETDLFKEKTPSWYVGGKMTLPLYLGGNRFKEKKKAQALLSEAEYKKDATSLATMKNGLTNYYKFIQYVEQMTPAFQAKLQINSTVEIVNTRYYNEEISTSDYLDIIQTALQTNLQSINTRYNYFASMSKIIHDLGIPVSNSYSDFVKQFHSELEY